MQRGVKWVGSRNVKFEPMPNINGTYWMWKGGGAGIIVSIWIMSEAYVMIVNKVLKHWTRSGQENLDDEAAPISILTDCGCFETTGREGRGACCPVCG